MMHSFARAFTFTIQNIVRNFWLALATVLIMVLTLFMVSLLGGVQFVANQAINAVQGQVDVTVYFTEETPDSVVFSVQEDLIADARVEGVRYVSRAEALDEFKRQNEDNPTLTEALETLEVNPLGPTLVVKAKDLNDYPAILSALEQEDVSKFIQDEGRDFEDTQLVIDRLGAITERIRQIGLVISVIFVFIAVLVTMNSIRVAIYTHRDEIAIMKLVGASNSFIRAPFVLEAILYAVIGSVITTLLFLPLISFADTWLGNFFTGYELDVVGLLRANLVWVFLGELVLAIFLAGLSAAIAVGRYLRV